MPNDLIAQFIDRIDRMQERYKGKEGAYVKVWIVPKEELIAVRDELRPAVQMDLFREGNLDA